MSKSCVEQSGRLELSISSEPGYREVGYELRDFVVGAFRADISFSNFSGSGSGYGFCIEFRIDDNNYARIERYTSGYRTIIYVDGVLGDSTTVGSSDSSGKLRLERTGMILRPYYWTGVWTLIGGVSDFDTSVGKMKIVAFSNASGSVAAYADDFVFTESTNSLYDGQFAIKQRGQDKISVARRGHRDYKNKVTVQYTKRGYGYMAGTIDCQDLVDIDDFGLMDVSMRLEGVCTLSRAEKLGRLFLKKNMNQAEVYAGTLGPQSIGMFPGDIVYLSSKRLKMTNVPVRVIAIKEGVDYQIEVEFSEEKEIYELDTYAWDNTNPYPLVSFEANVSDALKVSEVASTGKDLYTNVSSSLRISEDVATGGNLYMSEAVDTEKISEDAAWTVS